MLILFTGLPGSGKATVLTTFLKYLLNEIKLRICTVDLDYRTAKLSRILALNVNVLCDLYDVAEGSCNEVTHVVLSDRHVHVPVKISKFGRQDSTVLGLLQELHAVLEADLILVDSVEPTLASIANRKIFKVIHIVRPDIAELYEYAKSEDIVIINNVVPGLEPKLQYRNILYLHFDPMLKVCGDLKIMSALLSKEIREFCRRLLDMLKVR